jgi:hypothetical protein
MGRRRRGTGNTGWFAVESAQKFVPEPVLVQRTRSSSRTMTQKMWHIPCTHDLAAWFRLPRGSPRLAVPPIFFGDARARRRSVRSAKCRSGLRRTCRHVRRRTSRRPCDSALTVRGGTGEAQVEDKFDASRREGSEKERGRGGSAKAQAELGRKGCTTRGGLESVEEVGGRGLLRYAGQRMKGGVLTALQYVPWRRLACCFRC